MNNANSADDLTALRAVLESLRPLAKEDQLRILRSVLHFLNLSDLGDSGNDTAEISLNERKSVAGQVKKSNLEGSWFTSKPEVSPKEFLRQKQPRTDVERIACLAFYLTHYRATQHFKTADLSAVNLEAAQPKFSNASDAASNAQRAGFLAHGLKGQRQLSAYGEQFVNALPDHEAAKTVYALRPKRKNSKRSIKDMNEN